MTIHKSFFFYFKEEYFVFVYIFNFPCRRFATLWLSVCISIIIYAFLHSVFPSVRVDNCSYKMIDSTLLFSISKEKKTSISFLTYNQSLPEFFRYISRNEVLLSITKMAPFPAGISDFRFTYCVYKWEVIICYHFVV